MLAILKALLLNKYAGWAVVILAIVAGGYYAWLHYVEEPYREEGRLIGWAQGRAQERAQLLPLLVSATGQLDRDVEAFSKVAASFTLIKQNSDRVKQQVLKAAVIKAARNKAAKVRIEYIDRIVPAGANECERVFDVIDKGAER